MWINQDALTKVLGALEVSEPSRFYRCKCMGSAHWPHCYWRQHQDAIKAVRHAFVAPAPPLAAIGRLVAMNMEQAVANGANSVSMPDDLVEIARWLADAN